jgi:2-polyprenyl-3-methyl-5-hydroxy-6-metoxy-1,4-benzoquinol methylase
VKPVEASCNLCGKNSFKVREDDETPFRVLECLNCGLVFVHPFPDIDKLAVHYGEDYYREWIYQQKKKRIRMWKGRLKKLEKRRHGGHLLDVGCGDGAFLKLAQDKGWAVSGTEHSSYAANYVSEALGIPVFCGEVFAAGYPDNSFDVVTMWHVLEHVTDPGRYLREIHRILKPSGLLLVAVPNVNDYIMQAAYRLVKKRPLKLFSKDDREIHLYHFSDETLKNYLVKTGFECLKISPDYGITEYSKKMINFIAAAFYYTTGFRIFNALEVYATRI